MASGSEASRSEWFKQFVRSLDEKAPYEERKDLALNALRKRYGQESSLLASEDRLLAGACQHRAGKFPWGTSKKDREKSRMLASLGSVKVPMPAGSRKREHANSPASMPPADVEELPSKQTSSPSAEAAAQTDDLPSGHSLPSAEAAAQTDDLPSGRSLPSGHNAFPSGHFLPSGHNALPSGHNAGDRLQPLAPQWSWVPLTLPCGSILPAGHAGDRDLFWADALFASAKAGRF